MPGPVSESNPGRPEDGPYVPSWCYDPPGPKMCACGHHEGYHNDAGACLHAAQFSRCGCTGLSPASPAGKGGDKPAPSVESAVEAMAKAAYEASYDVEDYWSAMPERDRELCRIEARAALAALAEHLGTTPEALVKSPAPAGEESDREG